MNGEVTDTYLSVASHGSVKEALWLIDKNHLGMVVVTGADGKVEGIATDGDIRRRLLIDSDLSQPIDKCSNRSFNWVRIGATRELILKHLDGQTRVLPVLDESGCLVRVITREGFLLADEGQVLSRGRAPVRISFGGGGTDLTRHFFDHGGSVISATITRYAYATLRRRDAGILIRSANFEGSLEAMTPEELCLKGQFGLISAVVKLINPSFGFELEVASEVAPGSGLGGSASVAAAIAGCFNEFRSDKWDNYQLAEIAFQAERLVLNIPGGWQDQYASVFGGFNFIAFNSNLNEVTPLRLSEEVTRELEASLLLCGLGRARACPALTSASPAAGEQLTSADRLAELSVEMRRALVRGRLLDFGRYLNQAWEVKKVLDTGASDTAIDELYASALDAGAIGGKMLGAAGGGYLLLFMPPMFRESVYKRMNSAGLTCEGVRFEDQGVQSWKVRVEQDKEN